MAVEIRLTRGFCALVDDVDAGLVGQYRWNAQSRNGIWYAFRSTTGSPVLLHRFLTGYALTDHINGDGLDNRRANLRPATLSQNMQNRRKRKGQSRYKGLYWAADKNRWRAKIRFDGRQRHLGYFDDEICGALAYDAAAREHFGEFAALNFPRPGEQSALLFGSN